MIRYDFWCWCFDTAFWEKVDDEIDEQVIVAIFMHIDIDLDVNIERRDDFDATIERDAISTQNINFFDVSKLVEIDCFDVTIDVANEMWKNEYSKIDFEWLTSDVNINVDSLDDENVAKNVSFAIVIVTDFAVDVKKNVDMTISFDVIIANSFDVIIANSFNVDFAISFADFSIFFWWWFCTCWWSLILLENFAEQRLHAKIVKRVSFCFFSMRISSSNWFMSCSKNDRNEFDMMNVLTS